MDMCLWNSEWLIYQIVMDYFGIKNPSERSIDNNTRISKRLLCNLLAHSVIFSNIVKFLSISHSFKLLIMLSLMRMIQKCWPHAWPKICQKLNDLFSPARTFYTRMFQIPQMYRWNRNRQALSYANHSIILAIIQSSVMEKTRDKWSTIWMLYNTDMGYSVYRVAKVMFNYQSPLIQYGRGRLSSHALSNFWAKMCDVLVLIF